MNINRWRPGFNEDIYWVVIPRTQSGFFSHFGTLTGMNDIQPHRTAEFIPYVAGTADFLGSPQEGNPFTDGTQSDLRAGADIKVGLGSNLTLDATINPDFGQVEADPAEVNLTAFETFFPEQRPFFIEGNQLLQGQGPGYYYSRRIGGQPRGYATGPFVDDADFVDQPGYATILGAAKLTGRTSSGMSIGALAALTQREYATTYRADSNAYHQVAVEPTTFYAVTRAQQEVGKSASTIGVTLTGLSRNFSDAAPLSLQMVRSGLHRRSRLARPAQAMACTKSADTPASATSTAPRARSQRWPPPRPTISSSRARATCRRSRGSPRWPGTPLGFSANKTGGRHWTGGIDGTLESPGFELNDAGRLSSANDIDADIYVNYRENTIGRTFRNYRFGLVAASGWNFGGTRTYSIFRLNTNQTWMNFWRTYFGANFRPASTSDDLTRGGPLMGVGSRGGVEVSLGSGEANSLRGNLNGGATWGQYGLANQYVSLFFLARPGDRWQLSAAPRWQHSIDPRQYVSVVDGGSAATYGSRYVFASVHQTTLSMQLRLNYSFSPGLTLEVYAEPFAASGRVHAVRSAYGRRRIDAPDLRHREHQHRAGSRRQLYGNGREQRAGICAPEQQFQCPQLPQQRGAPLGMAPGQRAFPHLAAEQKFVLFRRVRLGDVLPERHRPRKRRPPRRLAGNTDRPRRQSARHQGHVLVVDSLGPRRGAFGPVCGPESC